MSSMIYLDDNSFFDFPFSTMIVAFYFDVSFSTLM